MLQSFQKDFWSSIAEDLSILTLRCSTRRLLQTLIRLKLKFWPTAQKPYNKSILAEKSGPPAWKQLPSWYQVSENDSLIPPDAERMFAKQINATTISIPSSHASPLSHPNEVAQLILNATKGIK